MDLQDYYDIAEKRTALSRLYELILCRSICKASSPQQAYALLLCRTVSLRQILYQYITGQRRQKFGLSMSNSICELVV